MPHLRLRWQDGAGGTAVPNSTFYSLVVHIPSTMVVLELISDDVGRAGGDDAGVVHV